MAQRNRIFRTPQPDVPRLTIGDLLILALVAALLYLGVRLATAAPEVIPGPDINLDPAVLPYYGLLSVGRMAAAYVLSLVFSIFYGYAAARNPRAQRWLMPLLDILQSVPILSFLPVVLLALVAILPQGVAVELAAIVLIFTSQVWNMTFSFYQSVRTLPVEYQEAMGVFRLSRWLRFKQVELPFSMAGLIWNSIMSWAGGWFFLMAAEIFTLGDRDFRLPGLGAYLQTAASEGNTEALLIGLFALVLIIVLLDQLIWRPLLAWSERFNVSQVATDNPPTSWFLDLLYESGIVRVATAKFFHPLGEWIDRRLNRPPQHLPPLEGAPRVGTSTGERVLMVAVGLGLAFGVWQALGLLLALPLSDWVDIAVGSFATLLRVAVAVAIALVWTVPLGFLIGVNERAARVLQPLVQIAASIPATALFPVLLLGLLDLPAGPNIAAILLMLLGTQWYILFNVIAGASAIPQDLQYTSDLLQMSGWRRWRTLILPALFPYIITGLITASGGAWNASIVAEFTHFGGETHSVVGLGAIITASTEDANYPLLLASTLTMIVLVVLLNRFVWRRLYRVAETRFRMDQ